MLSKDPTKRPSLRQILSRPFIRERMRIFITQVWGSLGGGAFFYCQFASTDATGKAWTDGCAFAGGSEPPLSM